MATMMLLLISYNNAKSLLKFISIITANSWSLLYFHNFFHQDIQSPHPFYGFAVLSRFHIFVFHCMWPLC